MSGPRILIVDDEVQLRRALRRSLEGHGYAVREADDGEDGLLEFASFKPDAVLLDLMLPGIGGVDVCRHIRESSQTPIIVLSVVGEERTKIEALDAGADDYVTKPFGMGELLARLRVVLRRGSADRQGQAPLEMDGLVIDFQRRLVMLDGLEVHLTPTEYSLLKYLAMNAGRVLTHPMILRAVWGEEFAEDSGVLRTCVTQLRAKLGDSPLSPRFVETEPGVGYRFVDSGG